MGKIQIVDRLTPGQWATVRNDNRFSGKYKEANKYRANAELIDTLKRTIKSICDELGHPRPKKIIITFKVVPCRINPEGNFEINPHTFTAQHLAGSFFTEAHKTLQRNINQYIKRSGKKDFDQTRIRHYQDQTKEKLQRFGSFTTAAELNKLIYHKFRQNKAFGNHIITHETVKNINKVISTFNFLIAAYVFYKPDSEEVMSSDSLYWLATRSAILGGVAGLVSYVGLTFVESLARYSIGHYRGLFKKIPWKRLSHEEKIIYAKTELLCKTPKLYPRH